MQAPRRHQWLWYLPVGGMAALVAMPLVVLALSWHQAEPVVWQHLRQHGLLDLILNTLWLALGVGIGVLVLGLSLAWLTAVCDFPGRRWLDWALMLPLAIPTYVAAFIALGLMGYSGPVLHTWRLLFGAEAWQPDIRSPLGVTLIFSAVLYPYVYMLARSAFLQQGLAQLDAARSLGYGPIAGFFRVALPMARPAWVAGLSLALMETLADFGAVSIFNYNTFTTAIYKSWFGFFNLQAAAQLASLLLLFVLLGLTVATRLRGRHSPDATARRGRIALKGAQAWFASLWCCTVLLLAFVVPVGQLLSWWADRQFAGWDLRFREQVTHTFLLGLMAAVTIVVLALFVGLAERFGRVASHWVRLSSLGYALPGSVLAVGVMLAFGVLDRHLLGPLLGPGPWLVGSLSALLLAYAIRFFSVGLSPVQAALHRFKPSYEEAARSLGCNNRTMVYRVALPLISPATFTAALLVLVDVMKEMPATLLLRPFGWDTLAVRLYELTSEGEWQRAALPALCLILVSILPVIILMQRSRVGR